MNTAKSVVILATGGTIAGTAEHASQGVGYAPAQLSVAQLLAAVPDLARVAGGSLHAEQVAQMDSKDMDAACWLRLASRCVHWLALEEVAGVVIAHGTDTLEETAWFLQQVLPQALIRKPVVLTCAMRPATALQADGPQNLRDAIATAVDARAQGVVVVAAGQVHAARAVRKVHPYRLDAFSSGEFGALGFVEEGRVRWQHVPACTTDPDPSCLPVALEQLPDAAQWPWVALVSSHAGADGRTVDALVSQGVAGLVVAATGNGTLHCQLEPALRRADRAGVTVWISTRCAEGSVVGLDTPSALEQAETAPLSWQWVALPPYKARISLQLMLAAQQPAAPRG